MEEKLKAIITKIEQSDLTDAEKEELYTAISEGLHASVFPVLVKYMPQDQIDALAGNPDRITVDRYVAMISEALKNEEAGKEIPAAMEGLLVEVERLLAQEGVK